jgi:hypothetical protein
LKQKNKQKHNQILRVRQNNKQMLRAWQNKQDKKKLTREKKKQSSQGYHETSQEGGKKDIERLIKDNYIKVKIRKEKITWKKLLHLFV